ncbi:hypothetical protein M0R45_029531 [Rubus argutus]|uniref:GH16 domain-containing protein n=1 Tax=Rubus argutus TaxID=59490 RepID=A0AAW1WBY3_RUBAR
MALLLFFLLIVLVPSSNADWPPSPGYWPSSKFRSMSFYKGFRTLWGPQHQSLDQNALTIWLDRTTGSGFKSVRPFRSAFYLSNSEAHPGYHDEVDIEFLGTTFGKPYTLQTNVYIRGSGDGKIIGREMKFHLWFDPTKDFHHYAILWSPKEIIFLVDDVPIRRVPKKECCNISIKANVALWFNMGCLILGY